VQAVAVSRAYCSLTCSRAHRDLHSFPTRRSSDLAIRFSRLARTPFTTPCSRNRIPKIRPTKSRRARGRSKAGWENPSTVLHIHTDRKSTRLNSSHVKISYAVFCLKKKKETKYHRT